MTQQSHFNGIRYLEESVGKRNQRYGLISDRQHYGTRDFYLHEKIKEK